MDAYIWRMKSILLAGIISEWALEEKTPLSKLQL